MELTKLTNVMEQLENNIPNFEKINIQVSSTAVGWHIAHSLQVFTKAIPVMQQSNPQEYKSTFSFAKFMVYTLGTIPRGKAKAPKSVQPIETITEANLQLQITEAKRCLALLPMLATNQFFPHPYFGKLHVKDSIKFLALHTQHHLKIIKDIVKVGN